MEQLITLEKEVYKFLIYPYWNVNKIKQGKHTNTNAFLIYPYWNVNIKGQIDEIV